MLTNLISDRMPASRVNLFRSFPSLPACFSISVARPDSRCGPDHFGKGQISSSSADRKHYPGIIIELGMRSSNTSSNAEYFGMAFDNAFCAGGTLQLNVVQSINIHVGAGQCDERERFATKLSLTEMSLPQRVWRGNVQY